VLFALVQDPTSRTEFYNPVIENTITL